MITKSIILLMLIHLCGDQLIQIKSVQINKHKSWELLISHVLSYGVTMGIFALITGIQIHDHWFFFKFTFPVLTIHFLIEWLFGNLANTFFDDNKRRMAVLMYSIEHTLTLISVILLFQYFLWN